MDEKEAEKKRSLRNEKLKAKRTSETEEQRKERLRIRREKDRARRSTKGKKRSSETDDIAVMNRHYVFSMFATFALVTW